MTTQEHAPARDLPPVRRSLAEAVRARPRLVAGAALLVIVAAIVAGLLRTPVYTASTRMSVARIDSTSSTEAGFQDGVANVANAYARLVSARGVLAEVARTLSVPEDAVSGRLSAAALPDSPMFDVTATAGNADDARVTANAAANALRTYVARITATNPDADRLFQDYQVASRQLATARAALGSARRQADARGATPQDADRAIRAQARVDAAQLRAQAVGDLYRQSLSGTASGNVIQILNPAGPAASDRRRTLVRYAAVGLIAGCLLGLALAVAAPGARSRAHLPTHIPER
ncbi:MAG: hypothetical protein IT200_16020 [Thermoleophilia bacterium]|nr:hypothetical protein [Thermoleophilia bacterium]